MAAAAKPSEPSRPSEDPDSVASRASAAQADRPSVRGRGCGNRVSRLRWCVVRLCGWMVTFRRGYIVRRRRLALVIVAGLAVAAAGSAAAVAINVATGGTAPWVPGMDRYSLWWTAGSTILVAAAALLAWQAQRRYDQSLAELFPAAQQPESWWIRRPAEVDRVVTALLRQGGGTVGISTALQGAGGFGKTTIARMTRSDPRVLRRYRGRVHWVTVGRDAGKATLAGLVIGLITQLEPGRAVTFTDTGQAADHLA